MGMEGKLRRITEFELASYRKNPVKFYQDLLKKSLPEGFAELQSASKRMQSSIFMKRIQERAASGLPPLQEDMDALKKQQEEISRDHKTVLDALQANLMGISRDGRQLSLYKDWHVMHYLLTGKSWDPVGSPLGWAVMGQTELPDAQRVMGYGPAKYLTPTQVREVATALQDFPFGEKASSFDVHRADLEKVYPRQQPLQPMADDEKQALIDYFALLRDFYRDAATAGDAMVLWIE